jgi:hypothetical protein
MTIQERARASWGLVAAAGLAALPPSALAQSVPSPAAYWSFDQCLNGIVADASGRGNDLILRNGAGCTPGRFQRAGFFDGVDDVAETLENRLNLTDKLTVAAWVKPASLLGLQSVVDKWYAFDSYALSLDDDHFKFTLAFPGGPWGVTVDLLARTPAEAGRWSHVVGVFNGSTRTARLYIDGKLEAWATTPQGSLQASARPVSIGSHPDWNAFGGQIDEVRLYDQALTDRQVRTLAGDDRFYFFGGDTNVHPEDGQFPPGGVYDFYIGHLGNSPNAGKCRIQDEAGGDIAGGDPERVQICQFQLEAARRVGSRRTYGFWLLRGPREAGGRLAEDYGRAQADDLIDQWRTYHKALGDPPRRIISGRTLFADVELAASDALGWEQCRADGGTPDACRSNQEVLEGFLQQIRARGFNPGVYTSPRYWVPIMGTDYVPLTGQGRRLRAQPFVLWLSGCRTTSCGGRAADELKNTFFSVSETVLGGMKTAVWQYEYNCPDYDLTLQDPLPGFRPVPADAPFHGCQ